MATAIANWGNSEAIRIPREILRRAGLRRGDRVTFIINSNGNLELIPEHQTHRRVAPARDVTYDMLFKNYQGPVQSNTSAWPDDNLVGAEHEAWSH